MIFSSGVYSYSQFALHPVTSYPFILCVPFSKVYINVLHKNGSHFFIGAVLCVTHLNCTFVKGHQNRACPFSKFLVCDIAYFNASYELAGTFLSSFILTANESTNALLHILSIIPVKVFHLKVPFKPTINISRSPFLWHMSRMVRYGHYWRAVTDT